MQTLHLQLAAMHHQTPLRAHAFADFLAVFVLYKHHERLATVFTNTMRLTAIAVSTHPITTITTIATW